MTTLLAIGIQPLRDLLTTGLEFEGLAVKTASGIDEANVRLATGPAVRAILLDIDSDRPGALDLCRRLRKDARHASVPILALTASVEPVDLYEAYEAGISTHFTRPIDVTEVRLRLTTVLRRQGAPPFPRALRVGAMSIDLDAHLGDASDDVRRPNVQLFTPFEIAILTHLVRRAGDCATTEELLVEALGYPPRRGNPEVIRTHVKHLRAKLEPDPARPRFLVNIPRVGYRLEFDKSTAPNP